MEHAGESAASLLMKSWRLYGDQAAAASNQFS